MVKIVVNSTNTHTHTHTIDNEDKHTQAPKDILSSGSTFLLLVQFGASEKQSSPDSTVFRDIFWDTSDSENEDDLQ